MILQFLDLIEVVSDIIEINSEVDICRDPKDNFLLATARDGKAEFIITGDVDLLELGSFEGTKIIDYQSFDKEVVF
jgi:putative PIN family toxin of toxin-antitoxin system